MNSSPQQPCRGRSVHDCPEGPDGVEHLVAHLAEVVCPSMAVVCVGNELCGDDGVGVAIASKLMRTVPWQVYDVRGVPENFLMKIVSRKPQTVLVIDAMDFNAPPGSVELFPADRVAGQGPSTHGPAPLAFLDLLRMLHPCRCAVLGIQPKRSSVGDGLSEPVVKAADIVIKALWAVAN